MNLFTSTKIKEVLRHQWPRLNDLNLIWLRAPMYRLYSSIEEIKQIVDLCYKKFHYIEGGFECEFRADQLMSSVWRYHYNEAISDKIPERVNQYFFGICLGFSFKTKEEYHNVNIALYDLNGDCQIALIDEKDVWTPTKKDDPYFIFR